MSYTSGDLVTLKTALVSGVRRVKYADGKEVEYTTTSEIIATIALIERDLAQQASGARVTHTTAIYNRGM